MIVGGVVSLITGLMVLIWPGKTLLVIAALIGAWLVIMGAYNVIRAFGSKTLTRNRRLFVGLAGLLYLIVGAVCLRNLFTSLTLLAVTIGLVWAIGGAAEIVNGFPKVWPTAIGLLGIAAGVVVFLWPDRSLTALAVIAGAWLIAIGLMQISQFLLGRRHPTATPPAATP
jgi:uncharacterized membrane protein HdeD (DUF308 family)